MNERIHVEAHGRRGRIAMCAGPLNVLTTGDVDALAKALRSLDDMAVIVLESASERAFSAGMDIADHTPERAPAMLTALADLVTAFQSARPATIAKVNGPALGGGLELVLLCDAAIASQKATVALPEVTLAAVPPVAAELLPRFVGPHRAFDLIVSGRSLDAQQAAAWGIFSEVVDHVHLDAATELLVEHLLGLSEHALRACKWAIRAGSVEAAIEIYRDDVLPHRDAAEGIRAFLEKRPPVWEQERRSMEIAR